ncbi:hypothetical protein LTR56_026833, partial [Elasticomyces elasticus]
MWSEGPNELEDIALAVSQMLRQAVKLEHLVLVFRDDAGSDEDRDYMFFLVGTREE